MRRGISEGVRAGRVVRGELVMGEIVVRVGGLVVEGGMVIPDINVFSMEIWGICSNSCELIFRYM